MPICTKCPENGEQPSKNFTTRGSTQKTRHRWCKKCTAAYMRLYRRQNPKMHMVIQARRRAKDKGIEFSITANDFEIPERCPILGIKLENSPESMFPITAPNTPALDRIRNDIGYVRGNVAVISAKANTLKGLGTLSEFRLLVAWLSAALEGSGGKS